MTIPDNYPDKLNQLLTSKEIAIKAHGDTLDKGGQPYINHPERIVNSLSNCCMITQSIAWLHDVVEDTEITLQDLKDAGLCEEIINGVDAITKKDGEVYTDYLKRVKDNKYALEVKKADILDNTRMDRLAYLSYENFRYLTNKYYNAWNFLTNTIQEPET